MLALLLNSAHDHPRSLPIFSVSQPPIPSDQPTFRIRAVLRFAFHPLSTISSNMIASRNRYPIRRLSRSILVQSTPPLLDTLQNHSALNSCIRPRCMAPATPWQHCLSLSIDRPTLFAELRSLPSPSRLSCKIGITMTMRSVFEHD